MPTLMIVDDEETIRQGLALIIERLSPSWEVIGQLEDGEQALRMLEERQPDLMIIDISMPGIDGLEVAKRLLESYPHIYKIILTGHDKFTYAQSALRYDVDDYLLKPLVRQELVDALSKIENRLTQRQPPEQANGQRSTGEAEEDARKPETRRVIETAKAYIVANYADPELNLEAIARLVFMNPNYISELFKQVTGDNFIDYLTNARMNAARQLLRETNLKSYEIAEKVGYTSAKYFSTVFRKIYGLTPTEYRDRSV